MRVCARAPLPSVARRCKRAHTHACTASTSQCKLWIKAGTENARRLKSGQHHAKMIRQLVKVNQTQAKTKEAKFQNAHLKVEMQEIKDEQRQHVRESMRALGDTAINMVPLKERIVLQHGPGMRGLCRWLTTHPMFDIAVLGMIIANSVVIINEDAMCESLREDGNKCMYGTC